MIAPDKHRFKRIWITDKETTNLIRSLCKGKVLNLCCGSTLLGNVNVDKYPQYPTVLKEDIFKLDLKKEFDTVVSDPPWKWSYPQRHKFSKIVNNHLLDNGRFVLYAPWVPNQIFEPTELYLPWTKGGFNKNISLVSVSVKRSRALNAKRGSATLNKFK